MGSEKALLLAVYRELRKLQSEGFALWWVKLAGSPQQKRGLPDLLIIFEGRPLFVELKTLAGKTTLLQEQRMAEIERAGARACVCRSVECVLRKLGVG